MIFKINFYLILIVQYYKFQKCLLETSQIVKKNFEKYNDALKKYQKILNSNSSKNPTDSKVNSSDSEETVMKKSFEFGKSDIF